MEPARTILLTGSTGYLGGLAVCSLLAKSPSTLVLPIRSGRNRDELIETIRAELQAAGGDLTDAMRQRLIVVALPAEKQPEQLLPLARQHGVEEIIHCAGCVDYFDSESLKAGNIDLTAAMLELGRQADIRRFTYLSTAFSCGYAEGRVEETLHAAPDGDPTDYTYSKREAERLVVSSGLPFLILRPSIVIGHSRDGRYPGKRYGMYQLWYAAERFLCARYLPIIHAVAPRRRLHLIHQDAFQEGFWNALCNSTDGTILHLVSREESLPTVRQLWDLWNDRCARPREAHYFDRLEDVPRERLDRRIRAWVEFTAVNIDIASYHWHFDTAGLDDLRQKGLSFPDATIETVGVCLERFMQCSKRVQKFLSQFREERSVRTKVIEFLPKASTLT